MTIMRNAGHKPNTRSARVKQLLDVVQPTTEWEYKLLEGHAHRLLNLATAEMNIKRVHDLLDAGAKVVVRGNEADDENGWTLLHHLIQGDGLCADGSNIDILENLLTRKEVKEAINHCTDDGGDTALYLAVQQPGLDHACTTLIEHGAVLDGSHKAAFGPNAGRDKKEEWQYLIERPFDKPRTVEAYLQIRSTDAEQAASLLTSLHDSGIIKHKATLAYVQTVIEWAKTGLVGFVNHDETPRKNAVRNQLEHLALRMVRWGAEEGMKLPRDTWLSERAPLIDQLVEVFYQAGCRMWEPQTPEQTQPKVCSFLQAIDMADLGAELERSYLSRSTQLAGQSRAGPRL